MISTVYALLAVSSVLSAVSAHADHAPENWRRDNTVARAALETRCGLQLTARRNKRAAQALRSVKRKRGLHGNHRMTPRQTSSNDSTCLITPEVTQGPYHILGEIVRQNITENQLGIPLEVSIDFVDISTCEPVQVWVDAWHANATGFYGGYIAETGSTLSAGGGGAPGNSSLSMSMPMSMSGFGPSMASSAGTAAASATYGATSGADSTSNSMLDTAVDDNSTFLRGVFQSDTDGHLTMYSIVPGWYSGRAQHFHIKAYPQGYIASNGTFVANSTSVHTGQFFFDNETLTAVAATVPYANNSISWADRVTNEDDMWYPYQAALGYNADLDITWVGSDISDGLLGSITVGLNMSYESAELSTQYADFDVSSYAAASMLPSASLSA
ncbi:aromatic compound dioxygenase [Mycena olivaceomarginata]|nr:aromatic compound dioxygenase [Mycena olivaceomarginata]